MTDVLWNGIQYISDKWIVKADEDAVREHFLGFATQSTFRRSVYRRFRWVAAAACACLCLCAAAFFHHLGEHINIPPKMESLVMEVSSSAEMEEYLGFTVPVLESKKVAAFILYTSDEYAEMGSIVYDDGSSFQVTRKESVVPENSYCVESISGVDVYFGWEDIHQYAAWTYNGYSCCYYDYDAGGASIFPNSDVPNGGEYKNEISSLILQLK